VRETRAIEAGSPDAIAGVYLLPSPPPFTGSTGEIPHAAGNPANRASTGTSIRFQCASGASETADLNQISHSRTTNKIKGDFYRVAGISNAGLVAGIHSRIPAISGTARIIQPKGKQPIS